jgi:hypothetical protein
MKHPVTRQLFAYWSEIRGSRAAPERQSVDPAAIRDLLADTFILEVEGSLAAPTFSVRLSGTRLNALFLCELKGQSFLSLWQRADRKPMSALLGSVIDDCCPVVAGLRAGPEGHRSIDLELVLLPLRHHGRTHSRVLGAIAPIEVPSWLGLLPVENLATSSFRLIGHEPVEMALPQRLPVPAIAGVSPPRRYGRFLVHEGGRERHSA